MDLHALLPADFTSSQARGIWHDGGLAHVVGFGFNSTTGREEALLWRQTTKVSPLPGGNVILPGPKVYISSQPWIAKDSKTGKFNIFVETLQTLRQTSGVIEFEVSDEETGLLFPVQVRPVPVGTTTSNNGEPWQFDLEALGVPRFVKPMQIKVKATAVEGAKRSLPWTRALARTDLPVITVRGVLPVNWEDETYVNAMLAYGYKRETAAYPTFFYLRFDPYGEGENYDPDGDVLQVNARSLRKLIAFITSTSDSVTYAARVDIVSHSKGGLVTRQYLRESSAAKVRRLVMCVPPNTGSVTATLLSSDPFLELYPTHPWFRFNQKQEFFELSPNQTLKELNLQPMPADSWFDYYVLFGTGRNTAVSQTGAAFGFADGDDTVVMWSQRGFEIINASDGSSFQGGRIRAFDPAQGGRAPRDEIGLPFNHSGFLGDVVDVIVQCLREP